MLHAGCTQYFMKQVCPCSSSEVVVIILLYYTNMTAHVAPYSKYPEEHLGVQQKI